MNDVLNYSRPHSTAHAVGYVLSPLRGLIVALLLAAPTFAAEPTKKSYSLSAVTPPEGTALEVGGMDWMPDGRLVICTRRGEVWTLKNDKWTLFASGLQEALGLLAEGNDSVLVMQRPELTRLIDSKKTGVADRYLTVNADFGFSGNYHEFAYGPAKDRDGYVYFSLNLAHNPDRFGGPFMGAHPETPYRGWVFRSTTPGGADGKFEPWAYGLRSPNGLATSPDGEVFFSDNQGEWIGSNWIGQIKQGRFYGNPSSMIFTKDWNNRDPKSVPLEELDKKRTPPAIILPYGRMGQSVSQPAWDTTGGKFGPFAGQMFVGDVQIPILMRCTLEQVGGEWQGACYPFLRDPQLLQGTNRLLFAPDGTLLVGLTDRGWVRGSAGLTRVKFTGETPFDILKMSLTKTGFELQFTKPVDKKAAADWKSYSLVHWHLIYHHDYGSKEADKTAVKFEEVKVSDDGRRVELVLPELVPKTVYDLSITGLSAADGTPLKNNAAYYTLNRLKD